MGVNLYIFFYKVIETYNREYTELLSALNLHVFSRAYELLDQLRKKAQFFHHNLILFPFGDDFRFTNEDEWNQQFKNLTQVFEYMNSHPEMKVKVRQNCMAIDLYCMVADWL